MTSAALSTGYGPRPAPDERRQVHLVDLTVMPGVRYSAVLGYIQAAAQADAELAARCSFSKHIYMKAGDAFEGASAKVMDSLDNPLVIAFTVYYWNRISSLELARRVKERWPECRVVIGGNDVTHQQDAVFEEAPWVDVLVHGEGEIRFRDLLASFLRHEKWTDIEGELAEVPGISFRRTDGEVVTTDDAPRIVDFDELPSPFDGEVWTDEEIASSQMLVYETNRGCPYSCAFCYWGTGATNSKVRQFSMERIKSELERIIRVMTTNTRMFIADANFGMLARDVEIAEHIVAMCKRYNKRLLVMTNWAKNTNGRVVEIASILYKAGLTGAITLSAQSFNSEVLQIANRTNIRVSHYRRMQTQFRALDIPTYTDLIWGMPGESYTTLLEGIEEAISSGGSPVVYPLFLLNNTDYTHERFREDHGLRTTNMPCDPGATDLVSDVVTEHARMPYEDWLRGILLRVPLTLFHKCLLRCTLRVLAETSGARTVDLLELLEVFLRGGVSDSLVAWLMADYERAWREPENFDTKTINGHIGGTVIQEEVHFQAMLRRMVDNEERAAGHARDAVDFLYTELAEQGLPLPDREELDKVIELDMAAAAVFRSGITHKTEQHDVAVPAKMYEILRSYGDVPAQSGLASSEDGLVHGRVEVPEFRARYPFSPYALSVWHASGRPLHDVNISLTVEKLPERDNDGPDESVAISHTA